jgi:hypothetical protein
MDEMNEFTFLEEVLLLVIPKDVFLDYYVLKLTPDIDCVLLALHQRTGF